MALNTFKCNYLTPRTDATIIYSLCCLYCYC